MEELRGEDASGSGGLSLIIFFARCTQTLTLKRRATDARVNCVDARRTRAARTARGRTSARRRASRTRSRAIRARRVLASPSRARSRGDETRGMTRTERRGRFVARTATTWKPPETRDGAAVGVRSLAPANEPVRVSPAMLERRPAIFVLDAACVRRACDEECATSRRDLRPRRSLSGTPAQRSGRGVGRKFARSNASVDR